MPPRLHLTLTEIAEMLERANRSTEPEMHAALEVLRTSRDAKLWERAFERLLVLYDPFTN